MARPLLDLPPDLVIGEAVGLDLPPASFGSRALALAIDVVVQFFLFLTGVAAFAGFAGEAGVDAALGRALILTHVVACTVGYHVTLETLTRGRSVGKAALGLRVVRDDGGPERFRQALTRALIGVVEFGLSGFSLALISSVVDRRGRRLGDLLAGTFVLRDRVPRLSPAVIVKPPALAGWAATADLGRVPDQLALAAREYLRRGPTMAPAARRTLGLRLADHVARHVAPPPPAGTLPEDYLAAVLAERRDRALVRLRRQEEERHRREQRRRTG